jgi:transposase
MALRSGKLILSEVYERYQLSAEELSRWEDAFDREGIAGLQARALARRSRQKNVT